MLKQHLRMNNQLVNIQTDEKNISIKNQSHLIIIPIKSTHFQTLNYYICSYNYKDTRSLTKKSLI